MKLESIALINYKYTGQHYILQEIWNLQLVNCIIMYIIYINHNIALNHNEEISDTLNKNQKNK